MSTERIQVQIAPGTHLVVEIDEDPAAQTADIYAGQWPYGNRLTLTIFDRARVVVSGGKPGLWLGSTRLDFPWLEMLKVIDFLRLDIPLLPVEGVAA